MRTLVAALVICALGAHPAAADVFRLTGGGEIEGQLLNPEQKPRTTYLVQTAAGKVTLAKDTVLQVVSPSAAEREYQKWLAEMPPSAEGNWQMAEWCLKHGLGPQRDFHMQRVLEFDPGHEAARHGLGFSFVDGEGWVRSDEFERKNGKVRDGRSWKLPHELALEKQAEEIKQAKGKWAEDIRRWRGWAGGRRHNEGQANILAIRDPLAADKLAEMVEPESEPNREWRSIYITVLGNLNAPAASTALVKASLEDPEEANRLLAFKKVQALAPTAAASVYLRAVKDQKDYNRTNLAASYLSRLGEKSAIPALIDALVTLHKVEVPAGGGRGGMPIGAGFGGNGGISFSPGRKTETREVAVPNPGVHDAVMALTAATRDLQYDEDQWRAWWEATATPKGVDLRRRDD